MVLLSGCEPPVTEKGVLAWVDVTSASPFWEESLGGVPSCVALEYMAQAMALAVGLARRRRGLSPKVGFVLGSRRLETSVPCFRAGERYRVSAACTYEDESFGSFDCEIRDAADAVCAKAALTAFQPDGEMTPEKMEEYA